MGLDRARLARALDIEEAGERRDRPAAPPVFAAGNRAVTRLLAPGPRYTTTDSLITNAASALGLGAGAAALTGAVTFESTGFAAAVALPLAVTKSATDLGLASPTYTAGGSVKASGPAATVGDYEVGFLQTVYESSRNFYYEQPGHTQGLLATLAPALFSDRKKVADTLSVAPVRDGDAGVKPWYGPETVVPFDATDPSTKATTMSDTPSTSQPWKVGAAPDEQHLVKTDGKDRFRSWLAVKHKTSQTAIPLNYADWEVDYGTTVVVNAATPAASVVTPTGTSGAKVTGQGDGAGGRWPLHDDPVANDVATIVNSAW
jgi:hypothetical protein